MKGTSHAVLGAGAGLLAANIYQTDPTTTFLFITAGTLSGLVPDLDIDGKLSNRMTIKKKVIQRIVRFIALLVIAYSYFIGTGMEKWIGFGVGLFLFSLASLIRQRLMLTMTGIGVGMTGQVLDEMWIILLGIYIVLASLVAHRSYTHSIIGLVFFVIIVKFMENATGMHGVSTACIFGYMSHLLADMKFLPVNKRGIKLFLPFSKKEI